MKFVNLDEIADRAQLRFLGPSPKFKDHWIRLTPIPGKDVGLLKVDFVETPMKNTLKVGDRVRHNYKSSPSCPTHGNGTVVSLNGKSDGYLAYNVRWDSGAGTFPYTYNDTSQEIAPLIGEDE